jgi:hypothetical protein
MNSILPMTPPKLAAEPAKTWTKLSLYHYQDDKSWKRKTAPLLRLVGKNGHVNLFPDNIDRRQYMRDLFTTMIDIKWRYNLMAAARLWPLRTNHHRLQQVQ